MKTTFLYACGIAVAGALLTLVSFFLGFHNDPSKFDLGQKVGFINLPITITLLALGVRARRAEMPAGEGFSYGRAVGTGTLIGLFSGLLGAVFFLLYGTLINPEYHDLVYQMQMEKIEAAGQPAPPEGMMRFFTGPLFTFIVVFLGSLFMATVASLVVGIFVKRPPTDARVIA